MKNGEKYGETSIVDLSSIESYATNTSMICALSKTVSYHVATAFIFRLLMGEGSYSSVDGANEHGYDTSIFLAYVTVEYNKLVGF